MQFGCGLEYVSVRHVQWTSQPSLTPDTVHLGLHAAPVVILGSPFIFVLCLSHAFVKLSMSSVPRRVAIHVFDDM